MKPLVSVCIPVYNRPAEVTRAVRSALLQTHPNIEVVVVDNASTDGTWSALRELADSDARVRIYRQDATVDRIANWQRSVELATGDFVHLLFSDDWLAANATAMAVEAIEAGPDVGFVCFGMQWHGDPQELWYVNGRPGLQATFAFLAQSATLDGELPVSTSCVLTRRETLLSAVTHQLPSRLPFSFSHGLGLDGLLVWNLADCTANVFRIPQPLAHSAPPQGQPNSVTDLGEDQQQMMWWAYRQAFAHLLEHSGRPRTERATLRALLLLSCVPLRPTRDAYRCLRLYRQLWSSTETPQANVWSTRVASLLLERLARSLDVHEAF